MFKGPNNETKYTLLPRSMSLRLMKTEYEILKRLNLDINIKCIGKTIEEENFEIQHSKEYYR